MLTDVFNPDIIGVNLKPAILERFTDQIIFGQIIFKIFEATEAFECGPVEQNRFSHYHWLPEEFPEGNDVTRSEEIQISILH